MTNNMLLFKAITDFQKRLVLLCVIPNASGILHYAQIDIGKYISKSCCYCHKDTNDF